MSDPLKSTEKIVLVVLMIIRKIVCKDVSIFPKKKNIKIRVFLSACIGE